MTVNDLQQRVQEAVDGLVESGAERGLQAAVYRNGEQVVDAVAGVADPETGRPVAPDTPFYCYSVGKGASGSSRRSGCARSPPWRLVGRTGSWATP